MKRRLTTKRTLHTRRHLERKRRGRLDKNKKQLPTKRPLFTGNKR